MAIIQGMTPATMTDIKPYEMPINEMAQGLISRQSRADDAKNAILAGDSALNIDTRPLEEDWDILAGVQSEYKQEIDNLIQDANGDFSQIPMSAIQSKAIDFASDKRIRALTAAKIEYDAYNKLDKEIKKEKGIGLHFRSVNPLTDSLYNEDGSYREFGDWDLEKQLEWQQAQELMFMDPVIGKTITKDAGWDAVGETDAFGIWKKWWKKVSSDKEQLKSAMKQAVQYYKDSGPAGRQHYRWIVQNFQDEGFEGAELEEKVRNYFENSFRLLMEKRVDYEKDEGETPIIMNKPNPSKEGGGGRSGPGKDEEELPEIPAPMETTVTGEGISFGNFATPSDQADYIENGGGILNGSMSEYSLNLASGTYTPPSLNIFKNLLTPVNSFDENGKTVTTERYFSGVFQAIDENADNPAVQLYIGKKNRAIVKIGTSFNLNPKFLKETGYDKQFENAKEPNGEYLYSEIMTKIKRGIPMNGKVYTLEDVYNTDNEAILDNADLHEIGKIAYGSNVWNKNRDALIQGRGWTSAFDVVEVGNDIEFVNNPMIDAAEIYYTDKIEELRTKGYDNLSDDEKFYLDIYKEKIKKIDEVKTNIQQYKQDRAPQLSRLQEQYSDLKEKAIYLRTLDNQAMSVAGLNHTYFDDQKNNGKYIKNAYTELSTKSLLQTVKNSSAKSLKTGASWGEGLHIKNLLTRSKKYTGKKKQVFDELIKLTSDLVYNKVDHIEMHNQNEKSADDDKYFQHKLKDYALKIGFTEKEYKDFYYNSNIDDWTTQLDEIVNAAAWDKNTKTYDIKYSNKQPSLYKNYNERITNEFQTVSNDPRVKKYFETIENMKKDFEYVGLLYNEPRDLEKMGKRKTLVLDRAVNAAIDTGSRMYRVVFNRHSDTPTKEELSATEVTDAIEKTIIEGTNKEYATTKQMKEAWETAYQGMRFDRDSESGWVFQYSFAKPLPGIGVRTIEIPFRGGLTNADKESLGLNKFKKDHLDQIKQTYQQSGGLFFDLSSRGQNGKTTRFHIAWADIDGTKDGKIKKGEFYMVGDGNPEEDFNVAKISKVAGYDDAIQKHSNMAYNPVTMQKLKKLRVLQQRMQQTSFPDRPELEQKLFKIMAQQAGLPALPDDQEWSLELVQQMIQGVINLPGGIGTIKEGSYTSPDGTYYFDPVKIKKEGASIKDKSGNTLVQKHVLKKKYTNLTAEDAVTVVQVYNPKILSTKDGNFKKITKDHRNGRDYTYVNNEEVFGPITDFTTKSFQQIYGGFVSSPSIKNSYTQNILGLLKDLSLVVGDNNRDDFNKESFDILQEDINNEFEDFEINNSMINGRITVASGRRSLEEQIGAYGGNLNQLTDSRHMYGAGIDLSTHDYETGILTKNGDELLKFFQSKEGQAILLKNNTRAMYHTLDKNGKKGWHIHIQQCSDYDAGMAGTFIVQQPGDLGVITYDYTTKNIAQKTGYKIKEKELPQYLINKNYSLK